MKHFISISLLAGAVALLPSCSKESVFGGEENGLTGSLSTKSLLLEFHNEEKLVRSTDINVADFQVDIIADGAETPLYSYRYAELPEVVTLPVGSYHAVASYGDNATAAFEAPYYTGSTDFDIRAGEITDNLGTITCRFSNVRVTVIFDPVLASLMSGDSRVEVSAGTSTLSFTKDDETRSGYFPYLEGSTTLAATFSGTVEGAETIETKLYQDVAPGNHYRITFKMHTIGEDDFGDINGSLVVDATVTVDDLNFDFDVEDKFLVDDRDPSIEEPVNPGPGGDDPVVPTPSSDGPTIKPEGDVTLDGPNDVNALQSCVLTITSEAAGGITAFDVYIISEQLNADELAGVGLSDHLDLVNPGDMDVALRGLNLPSGIGGEKEVTFDITTFLMILPEGEHKFRMVVTDADGTKEATLILKK